ncbi:hypothetical protein QYE76_061887 [Lolium multiflorum]|uniref:SMP domain-containing protein n=1 Tax=Lolium multiflorum TaxID=4521 RepID=A0AAD8S4M4_LOLMU|nr:hypothetical protein QYE76_061887 [Lolium multiflorum]
MTLRVALGLDDVAMKDVVFGYVKDGPLVEPAQEEDLPRQMKGLLNCELFQLFNLRELDKSIISCYVLCAPRPKAIFPPVCVAEGRAIGPGAAIPGGVAEQAEAAAGSNATAALGEDKVTIGDVLRWNATAKLPTDKAVTREDAAAAVEAEAACAPGEAAKPYGVGAALTAAARHNQDEPS